MPQGDKPGAPADILERPGNRECADCKAFKPTWASWNLGILICETCSGIHRNLGVHITKVKSTKLDKWKEDHVTACRSIGNKMSNAYYEYNVPDGKRYLSNVKSSGGDKIEPMEAKKLERWIRDKYEHKKYALSGVDPPHVRLERGEKLDGVQQRSSSKAVPDNDAKDDPAPPAEKEQPVKEKRHRSRSSKGDLAPPPEGEKPVKEKRHRSRSRKDTKDFKDTGATFSESAAASHFAGAEKAFATLGEWAADATPEKKSKKETTDKKEKKETRKHKHSSSSASPVRELYGVEGFGCSPATFSPGQQFGQWQSHEQFPPYANQFNQQYPAHIDQSQYQHPPYSDQSLPQHQLYNTQDEQQHPPYADQHQQQYPPHHAQTLQQVPPHPKQSQQHGICNAQPQQLHQDQQWQQPGSQEPRCSPTDHQAGRYDQYPEFQSEQQTQNFNTNQDGTYHQGYGALVDQAGAVRRAALQSVASLLISPQSFVPQGVQLLPLFGFDLQAAAFEPTALRKSKEPKVGRGLERSSAAGLVEYTFAGLVSSASVKQQETSTVFGSFAPIGEQDLFAGFASSALAGKPESSAGFGPSASRAQQDEFTGLGSFTPTGQQDSFGGMIFGFDERHATPTPPLSDASPAAPWNQELQNGKHSPSSMEQGLSPIKAGVTSEINQLQATVQKLREEMSSLHKAMIKEVREVQDLTKKRQEDVDDWWNLPPGPIKLDLASVSTAAQHDAIQHQQQKEQDTIQQQQKEQIQQQQNQIAEQQLQIQQILQILQQQQQHILSRPDPLVRHSSAITRGSSTPAPLSPPILQCSTGLPSPLPAGHCSGMQSEHFTWAQGISPETPAPDQACGIPDGVSCSPSYAPTITDDGSRLSPAYCAAAFQQVSSPSWELDASTFARYLQLFKHIDHNQNGFVEGAEARELFDRSQLHTVDLWHCWNLADGGGTGRLSLAEFCCAYHLVEARRQGFELPPSMPPELLHSAGQHAAAELFQQHAAADLLQMHGAPAEAPQTNVTTKPVPASAPQTPVLPAPAEPTPWAVTQEELDAILQIFLATQRQETDSLSSAESMGILEKSQLPQQDLFRIWSLSDVDCDGRLGFGEFACAMHLTSRRREGEELPAKLPGELQALAGKSLPAAREERTEVAIWEVSPENLQQYASVFAGLDRKDDGLLLGPAEAKDVLQQSGLPKEELAHIWNLSDVDGDGMLAFCEFACAMHLVAARRLGSRLPEELPLQLSQLVADSMDTQAGLRAFESSPWIISADQLEQYRKLFQSLEKQEPAALSAMEAKEILERSQLKQQELYHIWTLSDVDQDQVPHLHLHCGAGRAKA
eukprot:TRINITY_DN13099_c0_g1_i1.p1 TRINITY_DN13099_c0_g1~~TRINITY_DN13099_c0_g1_i1.p1  ORF type:complete len:1326 (-),score=289.91 TRINITY_DN13099_c0_g1_i1:93-4070(-)